MIQLLVVSCVVGFGSRLFERIVRRESEYGEAGKCIGTQMDRGLRLHSRLCWESRINDWQWYGMMCYWRFARGGRFEIVHALKVRWSPNGII